MIIQGGCTSESRREREGMRARRRSCAGSSNVHGMFSLMLECGQVEAFWSRWMRQYALLRHLGFDPPQWIGGHPDTTFQRAKHIQNAPYR